MPCTLKIVGGDDHDCFTLREAAEVLDPPIDVEQLEHLVAAARLRPRGTRHQPRGGRPPRTYPIAEIQKLHTAFVPWLVTGSSTRGSATWILLGAADKPDSLVK